MLHERQVLETALIRLVSAFDVKKKSKITEVIMELSREVTGQGVKRMSKSKILELCVCYMKISFNVWSLVKVIVLQ